MGSQPQPLPGPRKSTPVCLGTHDTVEKGMCLELPKDLCTGLGQPNQGGRNAAPAPRAKQCPSAVLSLFQGERHFLAWTKASVG